MALKKTPRDSRFSSQQIKRQKRHVFLHEDVTDAFVILQSEIPSILFHGMASLVVALNCFL